CSRRVCLLKCSYPALVIGSPDEPYINADGRLSDKRWPKKLTARMDQFLVFRRSVHTHDDEGLYGTLQRLQSQAHLLFNRLKKRRTGKDGPALVDVACEKGCERWQR